MSVKLVCKLVLQELWKFAPQSVVDQYTIITREVPLNCIAILLYYIVNKILTTG